MESFADNMLKFEYEYDELDDFNFMQKPSYPEKESQEDERLKSQDQFFKKLKSFTIVVPTSFTLTELERYISRNITSSEDLDKLYMKRSSNVYLEKHGFYNEYDQFSQIRSKPTGPKSPAKDHKLIKAELVRKDGETEYAKSLTVENWVKRRCKDPKVSKPYLRVFTKQPALGLNHIQFGIKLVGQNEEDKEEVSEEEIDGNKRDPKGRKRITKQSRTYSLYLQREKQQKSLQEREMERLVTKDIQSNESIREEIGEES